MSDPIIHLTAVQKWYGDYHALRGIDLDIRAGEFFSLLGPSGCGKTTLLRTIAGFEEVTSGSVMIAGRNMAGVEPNERPTNMVFQSYAIFPHMTVAENVGFGLRKSDMPKADRPAAVEEALEMVGLKGYGHRAAHALSGGQRQRVALARALILKPKVLLLDEPLSALDKKLREQMQNELRRLQRSLGITFILVTHDQEEALIMSDRIAVMFEGEIAQLADPQTLYRRPVNRRVADFIGVMNFLPAKPAPGHRAPRPKRVPKAAKPAAPRKPLMQGLKERLGLAQPAPLALPAPEPTPEIPEGHPFRIEGLGLAHVSDEQCPAGVPKGAARAGIRPETLQILFEGETSDRNVAQATVAEVAYYGDMTYYDVILDGVETPLTISMKNLVSRQVLERGAKTRVAWDNRSIVLFPEDAA